MILVCSECKASYLVPATVFAHGPRNVRCARCLHTWLADLPSKIVVMPPEAEVDRTITDVEKPVKKEPQTTTSGKIATENNEKYSVEKNQTVFTTTNLPAIWRNPYWRRIKIGTTIIVGILLASLLAMVALDEQSMIRVRNTAVNILKTVGLITRPVGEGLNLREIRSERRFENGGMQLVVEGEVYNSTQETLKVPDIQAKALGPDKTVIQDWRIEAPVATLPPGAFAPFHSSIIAPEGAVAEVNLSFVGPKHD